MSTRDEIRAQISHLPPVAQTAFAALCARRVINEARHVGVEGLDLFPGIEGALAFVWQHLAAGSESSGEEARRWLEKNREVPRGEDAPVDPLVSEAANLVGLTVGTVSAPEKSATYASSAADQALQAMHLIYEDADRVTEGERHWQGAAVVALATSPDRPIRPENFDALPEYDRGPRIPE
jgi:hypothetical protein